jgi:hypothetical protein
VRGLRQTRRRAPVCNAVRHEGLTTRLEALGDRVGPCRAGASTAYGDSTRARIQAIDSCVLRSQTETRPNATSVCVPEGTTS